MGLLVRSLQQMFWDIANFAMFLFLFLVGFGVSMLIATAGIIKV